MTPISENAVTRAQFDAAFQAALPVGAQIYIRELNDDLTLAIKGSNGIFQTPYSDSLSSSIPNVGDTVAAGAIFIRNGVTYQNNTGLDFVIPATFPTTSVTGVVQIVPATINFNDPAVRRSMCEFILQHWRLITAPEGDDIAVFADGCDPSTGNPTFTLCPVSFELALDAATTANIIIETSDGSPYSIDWGDGTEDVNVNSGTGPLHTYATPYTGTASVKVNLGVDVTRFFTNNGRWAFDVRDLPRTLLIAQISGQNIVYGNLADLPPNLVTLTLTGQNVVTGNILNMPRSITGLVISGQNTMSGDIADMPPNMISFRAQGQHTLSGNFDNLPSTLVSYWNQSAGATTVRPASQTWSGATAMELFRQAAPSYTAQEMSDILIGLSSVTAWTGVADVILTTPSHATPPTDAATTTAIAAITAAGATLNTN